MNQAKPLLLSDGRYLYAHTEQGVLGPLNFYPSFREDGQIDERKNNDDPYGCPFNPRECEGGKVHIVDNPAFRPKETP